MTEPEALERQHAAMKAQAAKCRDMQICDKHWGCLVVYSNRRESRCPLCDREAFINDLYERKVITRPLVCA